MVKLLQTQNRKDMLDQMAGWVNATERLQNKKYEVFEPSFDRKECFNISFMKQKVDYIHLNLCKEGLVQLPEHYPHSSAKYY